MTVAASSSVYHLTHTHGHEARLISEVFVTIAGVATLASNVAKKVITLTSHTGKVAYSALSTHDISQVVVG